MGSADLGMVTRADPLFALHDHAPDSRIWPHAPIAAQTLGKRLSHPVFVAFVAVVGGMHQPR